jgi:hypothetical protein
MYSETQLSVTYINGGDMVHLAAGTAFELFLARPSFGPGLRLVLLLVLLLIRRRFPELLFLSFAGDGDGLSPFFRLPLLLDLERSRSSFRALSFFLPLLETPLLVRILRLAILVF